MAYKFTFSIVHENNDKTKDRDYSKLIMQYPDGRQPIITTIDKIYKGLQENKWKNPALPQVKGYNPYISIKDIRKTKGIYRPKALIFLADELNELNNIGSV